MDALMDDRQDPSLWLERNDALFAGRGPSRPDLTDPSRPSLSDLCEPTPADWRERNAVVLARRPHFSRAVVSDLLSAAPAVPPDPDLLRALDRATPGTLSRDPEFMRSYLDDATRNPLEPDDDDSIDLDNLPDSREPARIASFRWDLVPSVDPRLVHIDWITARWFVAGFSGQVTGDVQEVYRDNQRLIRRRTFATFREHSSWSAKIQIKIVGGHVELTGNLNKWLHRQALFGISHPYDLICAWCEDYRRDTGLNIRPASPFDVRLSRIDLTSHIDLQEVKRADMFLSSLRYVLRARLPGETIPGDVVQYRNTVYWGQHTRTWALKFYNKYRELKRRWQIGLDTLNYFEVPESVIRVELTLRGPELIRHWTNLRNVHSDNLKREGWAKWSWSKTLACAGSWNENVCMGAFQKFVRGRIMAFDNYAALPPKDITPKDLGTFRAWQAGDPLKELYHRNTWSRIKTRFRKDYNIDLERPPNPAAENENGSIVQEGLQKIRDGQFHVFTPIHNNQKQENVGA